MNPSYTNPYRSKGTATGLRSTNSLSSLESSSNNDPEVVRTLNQLTLSWNDDLVHRLQQQFHDRPPTHWSWSTMTLFLECVFAPRRNDPTSSIKANVLLASLVDLWTEEQAYAASLFCPEQDDIPNNPQLTVLGILSTRLETQSSRTSSYQAALVALTSFWRALDCLEWTTSSGSSMSGPSHHAWWMMKPYYVHRPEIYEKMVQLFQALEIMENSVSPMKEQSNPEDQFTTSSLQAVKLCPAQIQCSVLSFLVELQKHHDVLTTSASGTMTSGTWLRTELCQRLFILASRLCDRDMPLTAYTNLSLVSLQLLILTHAQTQQLQQQHKASLSAIVSVVTRAVFEHPDNIHRLPRWTEHRESLHRWTLGILVEWANHHFDVADVTPAVAQRFWNQILSDSIDSAASSSGSVSSMSPWHYHALNFLVTHCGRTAREGLQTALQEHRGVPLESRRQPHGVTTQQGATSDVPPAIRSLVTRLRIDKSLVSLRVLYCLLSDASSTLSHDQLSRMTWKELASSECISMMTETLQFAHERIQAADKHGDRLVQLRLLEPKLLCQLDLMYNLFCHADASALSSLINFINAQHVETLIQVMSPKHVKYTRTSSSNEDIDDEDSLTPTANNLSRVDNSFRATCVMEEDELAPIGLDPIIRMAAATLLIQIGECRVRSSNISDKEAGDEQLSRRSLLQGRIMDAVNRFVDELQVSFVIPGSEGEDPYSHSLEMTRRRLRLLARLWSPDNEGYLSNLLHSVEDSNIRSSNRIKHELSNCQMTIHQLLGIEKELRAETVALERKLVVQREAHREGMTRFQRKCTQNAKQMVQIHRDECTGAGRRLNEALSRVKVLQERLTDSEMALETSRKAETEAKAALDKADGFIEELTESHQSALAAANFNSSELNRVSEDLRNAKTKLERMIRNEKKMLTHIQSQEESIAVMDESQVALKQSLECLFADMVSLAQLYEAKEKDDSSKRLKDESTVNELTRRLQEERVKNAHLEEKYRQTEINNNMLSSKYEQVRRLLEKEREERANESARFAAEQRKRIGSVSYMSHLNSTGTSNSNSRRERSRLELSVEGKENHSISSTSSRTSSHKSTRRYR